MISRLEIEGDNDSLKRILAYMHRRSSTEGLKIEVNVYDENGDNLSTQLYGELKDDQEKVS